MKPYMKLFLIQAAIGRWSNRDVEDADEETLEAIRELVGQAGTAIDNQLITNLQLNLNDTKTELTRVLGQLERVRGYAQNYLEDNGKLQTENDSLKARLKALEAAPATQSKGDARAARIAGLERARAAKKAKRAAEERAEGQKTNRPKTTRITKTTVVAAERWAALTQRAIDALKAQSSPIKLRTLTVETMGRLPAGPETHKLLVELKARLGNHLQITGRGTTHDPTMLHLVEPQPEPPTQPKSSTATHQWLTIKPELAKRLEHSNEPVVVGDGIPEEEYSPEVKEQIARMAALRPSAEERAKVLRGGY